jgi:hypothetical protein
MGSERGSNEPFARLLPHRASASTGSTVGVRGCPRRAPPLLVSRYARHAVQGGGAACRPPSCRRGRLFGPLGRGRMSRSLAKRAGVCRGGPERGDDEARDAAVRHDRATVATAEQQSARNKRRGGGAPARLRRPANVGEERAGGRLTCLSAVTRPRQARRGCGRSAAGARAPGPLLLARDDGVAPQG